MPDKIDNNRRSRNMAAIHSKNTRPELAVRKALYGLGIRYRLHKKDLPGKPDIFIPKKKIALFVHGCFWHKHNNCNDGHIPKSHSLYWEEKLKRNVERDEAHIRKMRENGIIPLVIWECEIKANDIELTQRILLNKMDGNENEK